MAATFTCDGCGGTVEKPEIIGVVVKRDYCPDCAVHAKDFLAAEQALRERCREQFNDGRKVLIEGAASRGVVKLPDVP